MKVAELLAKNTVEQMKSGKQSRHPFQELPVLPEDYGKESDGVDIHKDIVEESQLIDEGEGEDGDFLPVQEDGENLKKISQEY